MLYHAFQRQYTEAAYTPTDHVTAWDFDEAPAMCAERDIEDGGHACVADLAITQLVFRRLCIGLPYCRLTAEEVIAAMAQHVSSGCGDHIMHPRIIAQCRPLNLPILLRQMPPEVRGLYPHINPHVGPHMLAHMWAHMMFPVDSHLCQLTQARGRVESV
jgi:hypothetical protein